MRISRQACARLCFAYAAAIASFVAAQGGGTVPVELGTSGVGQRIAPVPLGLDLHVPAPRDNPSTPAKVALGRSLFLDGRLSRDGSVACATCHRPERAFTSSEPVAVGVDGRKGRRNAPTLINRAYGRRQFWDGRAASVEQQILATVQSETEMDLSLAELERRVARLPEYRDAFKESFPDGVSATNIARAIATYVRTLLAGDSPFDRHLFGDTAALSPTARRGMELFFGTANCWRCHAGPNFSDEELHNTGVSWPASTGGSSRGRRAAMPGTLERADSPADRGRFGVTGDARDLDRFKTPTLRNVELTAPYMHDGSMATLEEVIDFYNRGGNVNPNLDPILRPLRLDTADKAALLVFLRSLSSPTLPF